MATLATNWVWGSWFIEAKDTGLAVLMLYSIFGWPLRLAISYLILGYALKLCEGFVVLRMAIVLGVIGAGVAVFGVPGPWNLLLCATLALSVGRQAPAHGAGRRRPGEPVDDRQREAAQWSARQFFCAAVGAAGADGPSAWVNRQEPPPWL